MSNWKESLLKELGTIESRQKLKPHKAFIFWYIKATENLDDGVIADSITDGTNDGGSDAVLIAHNLKLVKIIQSKYTAEIGETPYDKDELTKLNKVGSYMKGLLDYQELRSYVPAKLKAHLDNAIRLIKEEGYKLRLYFITTHRANPNQNVYIEDVDVLSLLDIERKYEEWRHGHTPELGDIRLRYESIVVGPLEPKAYLATLASEVLRKEYLRYKEKLFSRNVRIFYGNVKKPNRAMRDTLDKQPDLFWYFNNGITILSEKVTLQEDLHQVVLKNPQIINGCQTVSIIGENKPSPALLFAKIVEVSDSVAYQHLVGGIIEANNRQNSVDERMLKSTHPLQVKLQRDLETLVYYYERKEGQYYEERKKSKRIADMEPIDNLDLLKANLVLVKDPHLALQTENEMFSTHFNDVFQETKTHLEYLVPYLMWANFVWWTGENHRGKTRRTFHRLARFHVLRLVFDFCPNLKDNTKVHDLVRILRANEQYEDWAVRRLYDIAFGLYKRSEFSEVNSGQRDFFKSKDTYKAIHGHVPRYVQQGLEQLFCHELKA